MLADVLAVAVVIMMVMGVGVAMRLFVIVGVIDRRAFPTDVKLRRGEAGTCDTLGPDRAGIDSQAAKGAVELLDGQAGIEQGSQDHVARGA
jgi:hypothetical protein